MLFSASAVEILFENDKFHPIFINPMNDVSIEETKSTVVGKKLNNIKNGDIIVVDKSIGIDTFQKSLLRALWSKFGFEKVEETENLWVFKLTAAASHEPPWFLNVTNFSSYVGKNGFVNHGKPFSIIILEM